MIPEIEVAVTTRRIHHKRHLSLEACELSAGKYCMLDLEKQEYASCLQEGERRPASHVSADNDQAYKEDWALKEATKAKKLRDAQKS